MNPLQRILQGFSFVSKGWGLLRQESWLFKWLVIPLIIDFILMFFGLVIMLTHIGEWATLITVQLISAQAGFWYFVLYYPLLLLMGLTASVAVFYSVFVLSSVVAAPFYAILVEKILVKKGVRPDRPFDLGRWLSISLKMLGISLLKAMVFLVVGVVLLVISFIPGLNVLSIFATFLIIAFDCMDYSFETMEMNFSSRMRFFKNHLREFLGMGAFLTLTAFIPGLTLLVLPIAVCGAADLFVKLHEKTGLKK